MTPLCLQAHDEICPKYPMICEGCAKKKIPREKVRVTSSLSTNVVNVAAGFMVQVAERSRSSEASPSKQAADDWI